MASKWDDLEEAARAATPGPWRTHEWTPEAADVVGDGDAVCRSASPANARYIAAAHPQRVRELLEEMSALEQALETLCGVEDALHDTWQLHYERAKAERDEARAERDALREEVERLNKVKGCHDAWGCPCGR